MEERTLARHRVLFGQPVKLGGASYGVIRIALGADMLIDAFCGGSPPKAREMDAAAESGALACLLAQVMCAVCGLARAVPPLASRLSLHPRLACCMVRNWN